MAIKVSRVVSLGRGMNGYELVTSKDRKSDELQHQVAVKVERILSELSPDMPGNLKEPIHQPVHHCEDHRP